MILLLLFIYLFFNSFFQVFYFVYLLIYFLRGRGQRGQGVIEQYCRQISHL